MQTGDASVLDADGRSLLHAATAKGNHRAIELLLTNEGDLLSATDNFGDTPLASTLKWGCADTAEVVLRLVRAAMQSEGRSFLDEFVRLVTSLHAEGFVTSCDCVDILNECDTEISMADLGSQLRSERIFADAEAEAEEDGEAETVRISPQEQKQLRRLLQDYCEKHRPSREEDDEQDDDTDMTEIYEEMMISYIVQRVPVTYEAFSEVLDTNIDLLCETLSRAVQEHLRGSTKPVFLERINDFVTDNVCLKHAFRHGREVVQLIREFLWSSNGKQLSFGGANLNPGNVQLVTEWLGRQRVACVSGLCPANPFVLESLQSLRKLHLQACGSFRISACAALEELWVDVDVDGQIDNGLQSIEISNNERLERVMLNIDEDHVIRKLTLTKLPSLLLCGAKDGAIPMRVGVQSLRLKKLPRLRLFRIADEIEAHDVLMHRCPLLRAIPQLSFEREEKCTIEMFRVGLEKFVAHGGGFVSELTVRRCTLDLTDCQPSMAQQATCNFSLSREA